jgi:uroporphyrinogen decarboxylase
MCYKNGPLISPAMFAKFMLPFYQRLTGFFRDHNIRIVFVDTDGNCWKLIPCFLEGGVTGLYPFEANAGMDVAAVRKAFPRLQMIGGIDKLEVIKGPSAIDAELDRKVAPILSQGGFIPTIDHLVPPDVSWANFSYFRAQLNAAIESNASGYTLHATRH